MAQYRVCRNLHLMVSYLMAVSDLPTLTISCQP